MRQLRIIVWTAIALTCGHSSVIAASNTFSQLSLTFKNKKEFRYYAIKGENALVLELYNTSPTEISGIDHYDERHVRRILVKDLGGQGTSLKLVLKNRQIRTTVTSFDEPFRVVVDMYNQDYREPRDQVTGMPLAEDGDLTAPVTPAGDTDTLPAEPQQTTAASEASSGKKFLLQAPTQDFSEPEALISAMQSTPEGAGAYWQEYPIYVYRLQTAVFESNKGNADWLRNNAGKAAASAGALANYAGQMFDYGHENRALLAYQNVLHKEPGVFENNALHLWRFAESHLGQGNLTLADGYFQSLIEKFPGHDLVPFAQMRRLDIQAIRAIQENGPGNLSQFGSAANNVAPKKSSELAAQLAIRTTYWRSHDQTTVDALQNNRATLVALDDQSRINLQNNINAVESDRTAFLGTSLLLNQMIQSNADWNPEIGKFAAGYFKRFTGPATEPFRTQLSNNLKIHLTKHFDKLLSSAAFNKAVNDYETLPISLQSIKKTASVAWVLAESYRHTGRNESAVGHYETAAAGMQTDADRFKANFWLSVAAGNTIQAMRAQNRGGNTSTLQAKMRKADQDMMRSWTSLNTAQKGETYAAMRPHLEKSLEDAIPTRTPAVIILERWTQTLATETSLSSSSDSEGDAATSASANSVRLLSRLATRFAALGMSKEKQQATSLMQYIKPASLSGDEEARKLWATQLNNLAEEYREANRFLEAGKLYALAGGESGNLENRAESLYKGGLLLYRAGRKEEAINAFRKAAEDANNQFYSNLAKERLSQLEP